MTEKENQEELLKKAIDRKYSEQTIEGIRKKIKKEEVKEHRKKVARQMQNEK